MKLPDIGQNPREYHDNLKSVVKFIQDSVNRIESLNKEIKESKVIEIDGKKYLDEAEVKKIVSDSIASAVKPLASKADVCKEFRSEIASTVKPLATKELVMSKIESQKEISDKRHESALNEIAILKQAGFVSRKELDSALKGYQTSKETDGKIKSCRNTMEDNYLNHSKIVDSKLSDFDSKIDKVEKSILKTVLDKISKLMG